MRQLHCLLLGSLDKILGEREIVGDRFAFSSLWREAISWEAESREYVANGRTTFRPHAALARLWFDTCATES